MQFIDLNTQYQQHKAAINARIQKVLDHGQFIMGPEVFELEERLQEFTGSKHCISCSSGTDALLLSLMALGVGPGDEVITSAFSFIATAEVIALLGATPVFVDIERDTCLLDANKLEDAISASTKAIIPVSLYGQCCDMDAINSIAEKNQLTVIEDAAQSFGARYKDRKSCNVSTIACTSFFPSKPLGCYGDGGACFTNDEQIARAISELRVHGQEKRYHHTRVGINGRLDTVQAAVLLEKLSFFTDELQRRQQIADIYYEKLNSSESIELLTIKQDRNCVFGQFTIFAERRAELVETLNSAKIPTAIHYPIPLHQQACISIDISLPESELKASQVLSLPFHPYMPVSDIDSVVRAINEAK